MGSQPQSVTIGAFAKAAGVNVETVRYYQLKGLLPTPPRPYGQIRRYGEADIERVKFVKAAQRLGFSLNEVAELLRLEDGAHCGEAAALANVRLTDVRAKLADLSRIEAVLSKLVAECDARRGNVSCPLIAALHHPMSVAPETRRPRASPGARTQRVR